MNVQRPAGMRHDDCRPDGEHDDEDAKRPEHDAGNQAGVQRAQPHAPSMR